jgi:hybrid cluster-associated redox disulfide protein
VSDATAAIVPETDVDAIVTRWPATARVFVRRRMACVDCPLARFESVADVCHIYRQPLDDLLAELRAAAAGPAPAR